MPQPVVETEDDVHCDRIVATWRPTDDGRKQWLVTLEGGGKAVRVVGLGGERFATMLEVAKVALRVALGAA